MRVLFSYLIFPGFLFSACVGLIAGWLDRKVTARLQWRIGPPWHQNFTDIMKLCSKEIIVPGGSKGVFLMAPLLGLASTVLVAKMLGEALFFPSYNSGSDMIVILYLLTIPAITMIIGASASRNPLASVGASREIKLVLAYELPFILSAIAIIVRSSGALRLTDILTRQALVSSNALSVSGLLAFCSALFCMQAKLGLVPFDASEADQEIMGGVLIEYSGFPLAIFKLAKAMMLYIMPLFMIAVFLGRDLSPLWVILKFSGLFLFVILVKNTNPRLRIDQSVRFFWRLPTVLSAGAVILASLGF
jgi:NADH-quinone oxidoreductase subunit H